WPEQLVACIPFRHITDALTPQEATEILRQNESTKPAREQQMLSDGYPAYTTSAGWLGYSDEKVRRLVREGLADGWMHFKMKVGRDRNDDIRRAAIIRDEIGPDRKWMVDANQIWDVDQAIEWMKPLAQFNPWWIEEPTSPDDVLGHAKIASAVAPIGVATGEACQNRVIFKQLLQANAISFCQIDSCRLAGVNEVLAGVFIGPKFGGAGCPQRRRGGVCGYTCCIFHSSITLP